jgi:hypothetical protein
MLSVESTVTLGSADIPTHLATGFDRIEAERHIETAVTVRHLLAGSGQVAGGTQTPTGGRVQAAARRRRGRSGELTRRTRAGVDARKRLD